MFNLRALDGESAFSTSTAGGPSQASDAQFAVPSRYLGNIGETLDHWQRERDAGVGVAHAEPRGAEDPAQPGVAVSARGGGASDAAGGRLAHPGDHEVRNPGPRGVRVWDRAEEARGLAELALLEEHTGECE